jgi:hypothetical protein
MWLVRMGCFHAAKLMVVKGFVNDDADFANTCEPGTRLAMIIDTNAILSFSMVLISNFAATIHIPQKYVPKSTNDVAAYVVGGPTLNSDIYIEDRSGAQFCIIGAAVRQYNSPHSYYVLQDPDLIPRYLGPVNMTSNEAAILASNAVRALVREGEPPDKMIVEGAGMCEGQPIPFYSVRFYDSSPLQNASAAKISIDARDKTVVGVSLPGTQFRDSERIKNLPEGWGRPEKPPPKLPNRSLLPQPATNDVVNGIDRWLRVCHALGFKPLLTNVTDVDWERSFLFHSSYFSPKSWTCRVIFKDKSAFDCHDGTVFNYITSDCYYGNEKMWEDRRDALVGPIKFDPELLRTNLQATLREAFKVPDSYFAKLLVMPQYQPASVGTTNFCRLSLVWKVKATNIDQSDAKLIAEFDQATGDIKSFGVLDSTLLRFLERAQKAKDTATKRK